MLPDPPIPPDVDLRSFPYTPLFRARLFGSEFHAYADDSEWRAGVTLWLRSWDQMPGGSLPDDDVALCRLAELGRDMKAWAKVRKQAMHGWYKCSDGRLYHRVVAEGIAEAWQSKTAQRDRTAAARAARLLHRLSQSEKPSVTENVTDPATEHIASVTENVTTSVTSSNITEQNITEEESPPLPSGAGPPTTAKPPRKSRIDPCWEPTEYEHSYAISKGYSDVWVAEQGERFRDHHLKCGSKFENWRAAWRTWVQSAPEFDRSGRLADSGRGRREPESILAAVGRIRLPGEL